MDLSPFSEFMANNNDAINQFSNHLSDELACADRVLADEFAHANCTIEMILKATELADEAKEDNKIKATAQVEGHAALQSTTALPCIGKYPGGGIEATATAQVDGGAAMCSALGVG
jgi:hypothetical protein